MRVAFGNKPRFSRAMPATVLSTVALLLGACSCTSTDPGADPGVGAPIREFAIRRGRRRGQDGNDSGEP